MLAQPTPADKVRYRFGEAGEELGDQEHTGTEGSEEDESLARTLEQLDKYHQQQDENNPGNEIARKYQLLDCFHKTNNYL